MWYNLFRNLFKLRFCHLIFHLSILTHFQRLLDEIQPQILEIFFRVFNIVLFPLFFRCLGTIFDLGVSIFYYFNNLIVRTKLIPAQKVVSQFGKSDIRTPNNNSAEHYTREHQSVCRQLVLLFRVFFDAFIYIEWLYLAVNDLKDWVVHFHKSNKLHCRVATGDNQSLTQDLY